MSFEVIDDFFSVVENNPVIEIGRTRRDRRNSFFRKEKNNPNNVRRYRDYIDDADLAIAHADVLVKKGRFENGQCCCTVLLGSDQILEVYVENKINLGNSTIRLRKFPSGWREDFRSWCIRRGSWRPIYYKHHSKNTSGMKQIANKHIRHKARLYMRDCDDCKIWHEEIAPTAHGWYKKAFESYDICDF